MGGSDIETHGVPKQPQTPPNPQNTPKTHPKHPLNLPTRGLGVVSVRFRLVSGSVSKVLEPRGFQEGARPVWEGGPTWEHYLETTPKPFPPGPHRRRNSRGKMWGGPWIAARQKPCRKNGHHLRVIVFVRRRFGTRVIQRDLAFAVDACSLGA